MNQIIKLVEKLSPDNQKEVINFIEFLLERKKKKIFKKKLSNFAGALKKLPVDPLEFQKKIRSEWD